MIEGATILIADDCSDDLELLKRALQKAGLNNPVQFVHDGTEVIQLLGNTARGSLLEKRPPLLLFLDLHMPGCTGFAVLNWLREQPILQNLPTIVLSNSNQPADIENCLRLGAHGYWVKPSRFEDLVRLMVKLKGVLARATERVESDRSLAVAA